VAESWFALSRQDQAEVLEVAAGRSGRPAHLLEKDIWVVWALSAIYGSPIADTLTFKGGTSLSKVYNVIDRFSEDIDLTYDIRALVPELLREGNPIPASPSQEKKITAAVRVRLPGWIEQAIRPVIDNALAADGLHAELSIAGRDHDKLIIAYPAVKTGTGYAAATVQLEFGARHGRRASVPSAVGRRGRPSESRACQCYRASGNEANPSRPEPPSRLRSTRRRSGRHGAAWSRKPLAPSFWGEGRRGAERAETEGNTAERRH